MTAFMLQSALLLLVAYFAGAFLGCIVRRTFFADSLETVAGQALQPIPVSAPRPVVVAPAPVAQGPSAHGHAPLGTGSAPVTRFEKALTGAGAVAAQPAAPQPVLQPISIVRPPAPAPVVVAPAPQAATAVAAAPAPVAAAPVAAPPAAAASAAAAAAVSALAAAAAARALTAPSLPAATGTAGPATVTAPITLPPVAAPPQPAAIVAPAVAVTPTAAVAAAAQDLTRIRAIDTGHQQQLKALGIRTYADIAAWKPEEVARIAAALKIPGRIEQENWIEQAQILAKGGETYYSRRKLKGEAPSGRPTPDEGERITVRVPAGTRPTEIASVGAAAAATTVAAVTAAPAEAPAALAAAAAAATAAIAASAKPAAPVPTDLRAVAAAAAAAVQAAQAAVAPPKVPAVAAAPVATMAQTVPAATAAAAQSVPAPVIAVAPAQVPTAAATSDRPIGMARDALQRIAGINGEVERLLNVQGVTRFAQVAGWSASDVSRFDRLLGFEGRIARENWIEQAQILSKGGETAYSREIARRAPDGAHTARLNEALQARAAPDKAPAEKTAREDFSALRSVRSEAYRSADAAPVAGPGSGRPSDDLKRIRGVGVLIEKKLNALGVVRYDQVANWSAADIERFSDKLDFKGRIERENWVEQARILSAGGQTEFSQRVDRGEVETSKPRT